MPDPEETERNRKGTVQQRDQQSKQRSAPTEDRTTTERTKAN
ncbi:hypothetical protein [Haladaptatus pallidirubidus]|nr:hypothetical protein [Haladaptatus pallidirubidus]